MLQTARAPPAWLPLRVMRQHFMSHFTQEAQPSAADQNGDIAAPNIVRTSKVARNAPVECLTAGV